MKKIQNIFNLFFNVLKYSRLYCSIKKNFFLFFLLQVVFLPSIFARKPDSFVQDSIQALKLHAMGVAAGRLGDYEEAIKYFNQDYLIYQKLYGEKSVSLVAPLMNLGIQYKNLGILDRAIEVYKHAEELLITSFGDKYPYLGLVYGNIGNIYSLNGDYNKALEYHQYAIQILK